MAGGKHASRSKSFEDLENNRRERARRRREEFVEDEVDDKLNVHNDILNSNAEEYEEDYEDDDYYDEPEINYKKIAIVIGIIIAIVALAFGLYKFANREVVSEDDSTSQVSNKNMPLSIAGYKVLGQVVIKDLGIEQYILNLPEDDALKNGVAKIYGAALNSPGNFCMAGHNYEGIFKDLEKLNVGDKFIVRDTKNVEFEYKVTSVKTVDPDDLNCLLQDKSKIEMTLITCSTGSTSRVVVKAEQVAKDNG